jgi:hypothetical protein
MRWALDAVGRKTRRAEDIVYRLDESASVLSRAVEVASPIDVLTRADTIPATITISSEATRTERLKTGANQSDRQFISSTRRVFRPTASGATPASPPVHAVDCVATACIADGSALCMKSSGHRVMFRQPSG